MKKAAVLLLAFLLTFTASCASLTAGSKQEFEPLPEIYENSEPQNSVPEVTEESEAPSADQTAEQEDPVEYGAFYYDLEHVVLYIYTYSELPPNYITKSEARSLGWEGGSVESYKDGAAIGGDKFGNREKLLPTESGRSYTECDIDTHGADSRGAKRLVFSNDGLYFYTDDHYESFTEVTVINNEVVW